MSVLARRLSRSRDDERGSIIVLFAVALVAICGLVAFAVDLGNIAQTHQHGQNSVDDAAISGAGLLAQNPPPPLTQVVSAVETYVTENFSAVTASEWDSCPVPPPLPYNDGSSENCITFNATSTVISVVLPPQLVQYTFGRAGGLTSATVETSATAMVTGGSAPCALCLLGPTGTTLSNTGSGSFTVTDTTGNAGIAVDSNGTSPAAAILIGSGSITAPTIGVVGTSKKTGSGSFNPTPITGIQPVPDPLAFLSPPSVSGTVIPATPYTCNGSTCSPNPVPAGSYGSIDLTSAGGATIYPGTYSSITVSGSGPLTLEPGTYVLTGPFSVSGSGSVKEATVSGTTGVFFYFTCSSGSTVASCASGQSGGSLSLVGSGSVTLSPMTSGTYAGLTVFYDRNNAATMTIKGSGSLSLSGTVYGKSSALTLSGSGGAISSMIDVASAAINGSGSIDIAYNASQNIALPSSPYLCSLQEGNC